MYLPAWLYSVVQISSHVEVDFKFTEVSDRLNVEVILFADLRHDSGWTGTDVRTLGFRDIETHKTTAHMIEMRYPTSKVSICNYAIQVSISNK